MSPQIPSYAESRQLWTQDAVHQRSPFLFTHVKEVTAIIVVLAFLLGLWFGVSMYHGPRASYPYYDTQKPVPPWNEPAPLEDNHNTGGDYK